MTNTWNRYPLNYQPPAIRPDIANNGLSSRGNKKNEDGISRPQICDQSVMQHDKVNCPA